MNAKILFILGTFALTPTLAQKPADAIRRLNVTVVDKDRAVPAFTVSIRSQTHKWENLGEGKDGKFFENVGVNLALIRGGLRGTHLDVSVPIGAGTAYPNGMSMFPEPIVLTPHGWEIFLKIASPDPAQQEIQRTVFSTANPITVKVVDTNNQPVSLFKVAFGGSTLGEGTDGHFSKNLGGSMGFLVEARDLTGKLIPHSGPHVIVEAPGFPPQLSDLLVSATNGREITVVLGKEPAIQCIVRLPDGSPAIGAFLCTPLGNWWNFMPNGELQPPPHFAQADAEGKIHFAARDLGKLWLVHRDGVLATSWQELLACREVQLQSWGRVTGVRQIQRKPKAGLQLKLSSVPDAEPSFTLSNWRTFTDNAGRFVFEKVPPGRVLIQSVVPHSAGVSTNHPFTVEVAVGKTVEVSYESDGSVVTGKIVSLPPLSMVDWPSAATRSKLIPIDEYKRRQQLHPNAAPVGPAYEVEFDYAGNFRAEAIPSGTYMLQIILHSPVEYATLSKLTLAEETREVIIPEGNDSEIKVGAVDVKIEPHHVPLLQPLPAACPEVAPLKLEEFRDKFLLIKFQDKKTALDAAQYEALSAFCSKHEGKLAVMVVLSNERVPNREIVWNAYCTKTDPPPKWHTRNILNKTWHEIRTAWALQEDALCLLNVGGEMIYRNIPPQQLEAAVAKALKDNL